MKRKNAKISFAVKKEKDTARAFIESIKVLEKNGKSSSRSFSCRRGARGGDIKVWRGPSYATGDRTGGNQGYTSRLDQDRKKGCRPMCFLLAERAIREGPGKVAVRPEVSVSENSWTCISLPKVKRNGGDRGSVDDRGKEEKIGIWAGTKVSIRRFRNYGFSSSEERVSANRLGRSGGDCGEGGRGGWRLKKGKGVSGLPR